MNKRVTIELSDAARLHAEQRVAEEGFESVAAYVDSLIHEDHDMGLRADHLRKQIAEGLSSPAAGSLSPADINKLVEEGIARAQRAK